MRRPGALKLSGTRQASRHEEAGRGKREVEEDEVVVEELGAVWQRSQDKPWLMA